MVFDLQRIIEFWPQDMRYRAFVDIGPKSQGNFVALCEQEPRQYIGERAVAIPMESDVSVVGARYRGLHRRRPFPDQRGWRLRP